MLICDEAQFATTNARTQTKTVVTTDKFYTRPNVMKHLKQNKSIESAGTVRNYGTQFPPSLFKDATGKKLGKGSKRFKLSKYREILATGFHDSTLVAHYTTEKVNHMDIVRAKRHLTNETNEIETEIEKLHTMNAMKVREYAKQRGISTKDRKNEIIERIKVYLQKQNNHHDNVENDDNADEELSGYMLLSNNDLSNICRARNLPFSGDKTELASRLQAFDKSMQSEIEARTAQLNEYAFSKDTDRRNLPKVCNLYLHHVTKLKMI